MGEKPIASAVELEYRPHVLSLWKTMPGPPRRALQASVMRVRDQTLSKLLGTLYDAAADPPLCGIHSLNSLRIVLVPESAGLAMLDVGQEVFTISRSWEVDPEATRLYQEHYGPIDVWAQRGLSKPAGYVCNSEALCPLRN